MSKKKSSSHNGIVYSTDPDFSYEEEKEEPDTLPPDKQILNIKLDTKQRAGKTVTLISGFIGSTADLEALGKEIKIKCGTGGSAKDGQIIIQGNYLEKVKSILKLSGYKIK